MDKTLQAKIGKLKQKYRSEGFVIIGVFGSFARDEQGLTSDLDILYELENIFYRKYSGFAFFSRIEEIREELQMELGKKIDFADKNHLTETGEKYILPEVVRV